MRTFAAIVSALIAISSLGGCSYAWQTPENLNAKEGLSGYMAERRSFPAQASETLSDAARINSSNCTVESVAVLQDAAFTEAQSLDAPLSPGDLVRISVAGNEQPTGTYQVESNGVIRLELLGDLRVAGMTAEAAQEALSERLVGRGIFRRGFDHASLQLLDRAGARIQVTGAVFQPGQISINDTVATEKDHEREVAMGGQTTGRSLSAALAHAGGVRPDADIAHVVVDRGGRRRTVDLTGVISGGPVQDVALVEGDRVNVPSRHCFQAALARPSAITPPGVRVFISNLTAPASNNAGGAVGKETTSLPYGTRMLAALVSGNCVGGIQLTNADRWAVLITTNPMTGDSVVVERRIEDLVRRADRDAFNPVLLPGDAIACYDAMMTNIGSVLAMIGQTITPAALLQNAVR